MIIGVYGFLSYVNRSSVNVFTFTINIRVDEASTYSVKYFSDASVLYVFFDIGH